MASYYAVRLAQSYRLSRYVVGFLVVAVISILPETFISINAAAKGIAEFGLGMLFGSNIADLTLILALVVIISGRNLKIESGIIKNRKIYPFILLLPIVFGLDGYFTRLEGAALIVVGGIFYWLVLKDQVEDADAEYDTNGRRKSALMLLLSMAVLLIGAHFTVVAATGLAERLGVNPILIGMLVVGLGTTLPELLFSVKSARKKEDALAVGDILGTVLADATIVVGLIAFFSPFSFPVRIVYVTGMFMVTASFILFRFMRSGRSLTRKEAYLLVIFWLVFVIVEFIANR